MTRLLRPAHDQNMQRMTNPTNEKHAKCPPMTNNPTINDGSKSSSPDQVIPPMRKEILKLKTLTIVWWNDRAKRVVRAKHAT